jgi:hypothetical protein
MYKDSERVDQIEGTYRDALNLNLYVSKGALVNESGNALAYSNELEDWEDIIGQCNLEDGRIVIFYNKSSESAIGVLNPKTKQFKELYVNADLNFQPTHTIEAIEKISSTKDILVYFTDNYIVRRTDSRTSISYISKHNPPRVFNISKQEALNTFSGAFSKLFSGGATKVNYEDKIIFEDDKHLYYSIRFDDDNSCFSRHSKFPWQIAHFVSVFTKFSMSTLNSF